MFCLKCGANLPDGSSYCNVCGADLRSNTAAQPAAPQQPVQNYQPQQPQQYYQGGQPPIPPNQPYQVPMYQPMMAAPGKNYAVPIICAVAGAAIIALVIVLIIVLGGNKEGSSSNGSNGEIGGNNISSGIGGGSSSGIGGGSQFSKTSFSVDGTALSKVRALYSYGDIEGEDCNIIAFIGEAGSENFCVMVAILDDAMHENNTIRRSDFGRDALLEVFCIDTRNNDYAGCEIDGDDDYEGSPTVSLGSVSKNNSVEVSIDAPVTLSNGKSVTFSASGTAEYTSYDDLQNILLNKFDF